MSARTHSSSTPKHVRPRAKSRNRVPTAVSNMFQHVRAHLVGPRVKTAALGWQIWNSEHEMADATIHIDYDGQYASERVLIVSGLQGRATVTPDRGAPPFQVAAGDALYLFHGFSCTWSIDKAPLVMRYGYFSADGKELKEAVLTCDVCGCDCSEESYLFDDEIDICPRCFKLAAKSAQQYESAEYTRFGIRAC